MEEEGGVIGSGPTEISGVPVPPPSSPAPPNMAPVDQTHSAVPVVGIYVAQIW